MNADRKVYVLMAPKQFRLLGVFTNLRKAAAQREAFVRDGVPCEPVKHVTVNVEVHENDPQEQE